MAETNTECIFCRIAAGEIPAERLVADEASLAFMDIGPLAEGHVLLVPREHYETLDDMPAETAGAMLRHLPALVRAVQTATGCQGVNVLQNNGRVAHQVVPHVHFHVIPRDEGDAFAFNWPAGSYAEGRMAELAEQIRSHMPE
ncbi:MAG: HIT family protein [Phycisphaerae bacterium]|nr:HIT family protein [Phycisphaerae bacterium]